MSRYARCLVIGISVSVLASCSIWSKPRITEALIATDSISDLDEIVAKGADVNVPISERSDGRPIPEFMREVPLVTAYRLHKPNMFAHLISLGANVEVRGPSDAFTLASTALLDERWEEFAALVDGGANLNNDHGSQVSIEDVIAVLSEIRGTDDHEKLFSAIKRRLISRDDRVCPNYVGDGGVGLLRVAIWYKEYDLVEPLILSGVDVNEVFLESGPVLASAYHIEIESERRKVVEILYRYGAKTELFDAHLRSLLKKSYVNFTDSVLSWYRPEIAEEILGDEAMSSVPLKAIEPRTCRVIGNSNQVLIEE